MKRKLKGETYEKTRKYKKSNVAKKNELIYNKMK